MLFLWSREQTTVAANPRAGPWFAWFATAVLLWRCRRRIFKAVFGASASLRLLQQRKRGQAAGAGAGLLVGKTRRAQTATKQQQQQQQQRRHRLASAPASAPTSPERRTPQHVVRFKYQENSSGQHTKRLKRLNEGDGLHIPDTRKHPMNTSCLKISQQLYYRVTRSGRVYGRYPNKSVRMKPQPIK